MQRLSVVLGVLLCAVFGSAQEEGQSSNASGKTTAQVESMSKQITNPWGVRYFNWITYGLDSAAASGETTTAYNYFSLEYEFSDRHRLALRPVFLFDLGAGENEDLRLGTSYIQFQDSGLATLPWDVSLIGTYRLYLPTEEDLVDDGFGGRALAWHTLSKKVSPRWSLVWHGLGQYYFFNRQGKFDAQVDPVTGVQSFEFSAHPNWGLTQFFEVYYKVFEGLSLLQLVGTDTTFYRASDLQDDMVEVVTGAVIGLGGTWEMELSVRQASNIRSGSFRLFNPSESVYSVVSAGRF